MDWGGGGSKQLFYFGISSTMAEPPFERTKIVIVVDRFVVVNAVGQRIEVTRTCHNLTRNCHNSTRTCHNLTQTYPQVRLVGSEDIPNLSQLNRELSPQVRQVGSEDITTIHPKEELPIYFRPGTKCLQARRPNPIPNLSKTYPKPIPNLAWFRCA